MTTISMELPDALADALKAAEAETGADGRDLAMAALREFLGERRFILTDKQQRADIAEALREVGLDA